MKVERKFAEEQIEKWIDFKRVKKSIRKRNEEQEKILIEAIEYGDLNIEDDMSLTYTLLEPVKTKEGDIMLDKLTFMPRIRKEQLNRKYSGIKTTDADGRLLATIAALTEKNTGLIGKLYTEDISVCESIAVYFL